MEWHNTTVPDRDPIGAVRELKQQAGADIVQNRGSVLGAGQ